MERGSSFASKAILYSQDPGSRSSGGKYTLHRKRPRMVKEFRDEAFSLEEGEISQPFKTDFGWHIVKLLDKKSLLLADENLNVTEDIMALLNKKLKSIKLN